MIVFLLIAGRQRGLLLIVAALSSLLLAGCNDSTVVPATVTTSPTLATPTATALPTAASTAIPLTVTPIPAPTSTALVPTATPEPAIFGLSSFDFVDSQHGWGFGDECTTACTPVLRLTNDGGRTWKPGPNPKLNIPTGKNFYEYVNQIRFANLKDGWIFGPGFFATHDGGLTWESNPNVSKVTTLVPVGNSIWAFGEYCSQPQTCISGLLSSTDAGRNWQLLPNQPFSLRKDESRVILIKTSPQNAWIYNWNQDKSVLVTTQDGGKTWQTIQTPCDWRAVLSALDVNRGWLMCMGQPATAMVAKSLYATTDGGKTWILVSEVSYKSIIGELPIIGLAGQILFISPTQGFMTLSRTVFHATTDGGKTWQAPLNGRDWQRDGGQKNLIFVDKQHGWFLSYDNIMFRTTDGGATWEDIEAR